MLSDIEIAQRAKLRPIREVAAELALEEDDLEFYGKYKAKVNAEAIQARAKARGKLVLVTGISPTPAGEGKSTVSVGLADGLRLRKNSSASTIPLCGMPVSPEREP
jgi:formate--tetrahydrofolate ligase